MNFLNSLWAYDRHITENKPFTNLEKISKNWISVCLTADSTLLLTGTTYWTPRNAQQCTKYCTSTVLCTCHTSYTKTARTLGRPARMVASAPAAAAPVSVSRKGCGTQGHCRATRWTAASTSGRPPPGRPRQSGRWAGRARPRVLRAAVGGDPGWPPAMRRAWARDPSECAVRIYTRTGVVHYMSMIVSNYNKDWQQLLIILEYKLYKYSTVQE